MRGNVLMVEDRDEILRGICENLSARSIAARLGRNQSVISREITRNGGRDNYRGHTAQERYETLKTRPKPRKLEKTSDCMIRSQISCGTTSRRSRSRAD